MGINLGVLVSGRGSNLQAMIDGIARGEIDAEIRIVASDTPKALAIERAKKSKIKTFVLDGEKMEKGELEDRIIKIFREEKVNLVVLAGFMRILSPTFISSFRYKIINIHPSLLPSFPGLEAQKQAVEYGVKVSGCTVHYVDEGMDTGPIILQKEVFVKEEDTPETLADRILKEEHLLLPEAINLIAEDRLYIEGRIVKTRGEVVP